MPLPVLSFRHSFVVADFPHEWHPLLHLYDPDLPLFPTSYFHILRPNLGGQRPLDNDRAYGYVERIAVLNQGGAEVTVITNQDLTSPANAALAARVIEEVRHRLGVANAVTLADISNAFGPPYQDRNAVLVALWHRVVARSYGNKLPFGRLWDEVLGLGRWVASWNTPSGRKGELIMTHYYASRFGERVASAAGLPQVDFYLLPTVVELTTPGWLTDFPNYEHLTNAVEELQSYRPPGGAIPPFQLRTVGAMQVLGYQNKWAPGKFNTAKVMQLIDAAVSPANRRAAYEAFNAFDKGPGRTIIFFMMLADLRASRLQMGALSAADVGALYDGLKNSYQSPKAISIYAQQAFGNPNATPIDTWVETFFATPLKVVQMGSKSFASVFSAANNFGKVERLIWVAAQARKVHSSACDDALWCTKYSSTGEPRGANPLACTICLPAVRRVCPAHAAIVGDKVEFNGSRGAARFHVETSAHNNTAGGQAFISVYGLSLGRPILDDFSPVDDSAHLRTFPAAGHAPDTPVTVSEFVTLYRA